MLPFSTSGSIHVSVPATRTLPFQAILDSIATQLDDLHASKVIRGDDRLQFKGGLIRPFVEWDLLSPIHHGAIQVKPDFGGVRVKYELWFTQYLLVSGLVMVALLGLFSIPSLRVPLWASALTCGAIWFFLLGFGEKFTVVRFPQLLRKAVQEGLGTDEETR